MPSNCVWLQIIFYTCVKETVVFSFLRSLLRENGRSLRFPRIFIKKKPLGDRLIKQLLNSVIAKYRNLSVSRRSIICRSRKLRQIIDLRDTDKSRYFAITELLNLSCSPLTNHDICSTSSNNCFLFINSYFCLVSYNYI